MLHPSDNRRKNKIAELWLKIISLTKEKEILKTQNAELLQRIKTLEEKS